MKSLPLKMKYFLLLLYVVAVASLYFFINSYKFLVYDVNYINILFFGVLMALTETFNVSFRDISVSTSFAIQLASFIILGPFNAIIVGIIGITFRVAKAGEKRIHILNTPLYKTIFNYCIFTLPIIYGTYIYTFLNGKFPISNIYFDILPLIFYILIYLLTNTTIISILFSILYNKSFFFALFNNIKLAFLNILAMAPFGIALSIVFKSYRYVGVIFLMFPIVLARYTFSLYLATKSQYVQTVNALMAAMEARDKYTEGHSQRVSEITNMIAGELKLGQAKIEELSISSLLHDVGKIGIEDSILNKPGKLTNEEYKIIQEHTLIGYNILKDVSNLKDANRIVKYHHERYDGKGYPEGKKGDELPLEVFIVQLADCIDAMATDRPYRKALTEEQIVSEIKKCSGSQFHPVVVEAYFKAIKNKKKNRG